ncbi:MAG: cobyric acid synthase [Dissulfuribacterales bacterium]
MTKAIMFQGTGSGVGKSLLTAAFCRILHQQGIRVAPFKAQNMALNSFVTADGREMGRAQVYQAEACGLQPDVRMNPILMKPTGDMRSQIIVMGKPVGTLSGKEYYANHHEFLEVTRSAYDSLAKEFDAIVIEGAGSPAEINLQHRDLVNMKMAEYAKAPVILVGDIDRGGIFAWLKGTYDLVQDHYKPLLQGYIINKFRGDKGLLQPGIDQFSRIFSLPCMGVLPWFNDITVDQEDGVHLHQSARTKPRASIQIAILKLPRISNFTDFTPFDVETDVSVIFTNDPDILRTSDCILIPGTKNTRADLEFLHKNGLIDAIYTANTAGKPIWGICGGYQMLGMAVHDPNGVEGPAGSTHGIGLLPVETTMTAEKWLEQTAIPLNLPALGLDCDAHGYEIHMGKTVAKGLLQPISLLKGAEFGAMMNDGLVLGTYLHGIFENDRVRLAFLNLLRRQKGLPERQETVFYRAFKAQNLNKLAEWMITNVDMDSLMAVLNNGIHSEKSCP